MSISAEKAIEKITDFAKITEQNLKEADKIEGWGGLARKNGAAFEFYGYVTAIIQAFNNQNPIKREQE